MWNNTCTHGWHLILAIIFTLFTAILLVFSKSPGIRNINDLLLGTFNSMLPSVDYLVLKVQTLQTSLWLWTKESQLNLIEKCTEANLWLHKYGRKQTRNVGIFLCKGQIWDHILFRDFQSDFCLLNNEIY